MGAKSFIENFDKKFARKRSTLVFENGEPWQANSGKKNFCQTSFNLTKKINSMHASCWCGTSFDTKGQLCNGFLALSKEYYWKVKTRDRKTDLSWLNFCVLNISSTLYHHPLWNIEKGLIILEFSCFDTGNDFFQVDSVVQWNHRKCSSQ